MKKAIVGILLAASTISTAGAVSQSFSRAANNVLIKTGSVKTDCKKALPAKVYSAFSKTLGKAAVCGKMRMGKDMAMSMTELALGTDNMAAPWDGDDMMMAGIFATGNHEVATVMILSQYKTIIIK